MIGKVEYKIGSVYLYAHMHFLNDIREVEILDISQDAQAVKTDEYGWMVASEFHKGVKGKIGHVEYRGWIFKRRVIVKD